MSTLYTSVVGGGAPDAPAIIVGSGGATYTRAQIHGLAVQLACTLRDSGIQPGDVITVVDNNSTEFVVSFLAVTYARAVAAPLNQNYTQDEFKYYMEDAGSRLLITGALEVPAAEASGIVPSLAVRVTPSNNGAPSLTIAHRTGQFNLNVSPETSAVPDPPLGDDVALFLHTSGTTSRPKGVPLTHSNLVASLENIVATYEFTPEDCSLLVMPLFHVHGLMAGLMAVLSAGAAVVLPAGGKFSAATFWQDAVAHNVTFYTAVPTIHQVLVARANEDFPKSNPPPLRVIRSCSSSLAPATLEQVETAFGAPVLEAYAMTEASHQMTSNPLPKHGPRKPGTVGRAQGSVKVTILDETCRELPPGEIGEICIRGPNVTAGYKNNPAANEEAFAGGWFHTGDQGFIDEEGYVALTGRLKELINRGGEKISPLEVDATMLSHPWIGEAASFSAPDEKYGEVVAAVVVLNDAGKKAVAAGEDAVASLKAHCGAKLASFKVPVQVFIAESIPKNPTGKIQRRILVDHFIHGKKEDASPSTSGAAPRSSLPIDGFYLVARSLAKLGVRHMFGVVGIPVTQLASAAQACGIRFISCRNEQAAGYAASAAGFLTGIPGVLLTVSGPGVVHGLAGLSNAQINRWPMIMISGSCETAEVGKGSFQELDQMAAVQQYVKLAVKASTLQDIPKAVMAAFQATLTGCPGAAYIDLPSDVLMHIGGDSEAASLEALPASPPRPDLIGADAADVATAAALIRSAKQPLLVVGPGAAYARGEDELRRLVDAWQIPFISASMARGVVPDDHPLCVNASRSMALAGADVAIVFGARLNWQLHFGEQKWSADVKFVLVGTEPPEHDRAIAASVLRGNIIPVVKQLIESVPSAWGSGDWNAALTHKAAAACDKLAVSLQATAFPLNYRTTLRVIRDELIATSPAPVVVSEGANTMDQARLLLEPVDEPRCRLDAGTWGTMGVGPGYALAAAVTCPERCVVAVEGDSAFGFSAMEVETACRYSLPITFIIFNNGGIYGGDRREASVREAAHAGLTAAGFGSDPAPTAFVPNAKYEMLAQAFGGVGVAVVDAAGLQAALREALQGRRTTVINVTVDPLAGVESGNVHSFNAPRK